MWSTRTVPLLSACLRRVEATLLVSLSVSFRLLHMKLRGHRWLTVGVAPLSNGVARFDQTLGFGLTAYPGSEQYIYASAQVEGLGTIHTSTISFRLRQCHPGERLDNNVCRPCDKGSSSVANNSITCASCDSGKYADQVRV